MHVILVTVRLQSRLLIRQNQFNLLFFWQGQHKKYSQVGLQNKFVSFQFLGSTFWKEKIFFLVNKEKKAVIVSVQSILSLSNKIQEHL